MESGAVPTQVIYNLFSSTNVTAGAWVELDAALNEHSSYAEINNTSTSILKLAIGGSGAEVEIPMYIMPSGGNGRIPFWLPKGARLAVRAVDATASTGFLIINLWR